MDRLLRFWLFEGCGVAWRKELDESLDLRAPVRVRCNQHHVCPRQFFDVAKTTDERLVRVSQSQIDKTQTMTCPDRCLHQVHFTERHSDLLRRHVLYKPSVQIVWYVVVLKRNKPVAP